MGLVEVKAIRVSRDFIRQRHIVVQALLVFEWAKKTHIKNVSYSKLTAYVGTGKEYDEFIDEAARKSGFEFHTHNNTPVYRYKGQFKGWRRYGSKRRIRRSH